MPAMAGFELTRSDGNHGSATLNRVVFFNARFESTQCLGRFRQVFNVYNPCSRDAPCGVPLLRVGSARDAQKPKAQKLKIHLLKLRPAPGYL